MPGSLIDFLPPEAQSLLGVIALVVALVGLIVWAAGIKIARFSVAMLTGTACAAAGALLLPKFTPVAPLTGALVGFALGAMAGALGFRLLQGLTLALCLSLAITGAYYEWYVAGATHPGKHADTQATSLLISTDLLPTGPTTQPHSPTTTQHTATAATNLETFIQRLADRWEAIPPVDQKRLLIIGIGTAAVVLLIAFGFPRPTTWVTSACIGTLLMLAGTRALLTLYAPTYSRLLPTTPTTRYALLALVALMGMVLQYRLFWPRRLRPRPGSPPAPEAAAAI